MRQHDREESMLDEVAQAIAQQILGRWLYAGLLFDRHGSFLQIGRL